MATIARWTARRSTTWLHERFHFSLDRQASSPSLFMLCSYCLRQKCVVYIKKAIEMDICWHDEASQTWEDLLNSPDVSDVRLAGEIYTLVDEAGITNEFHGFLSKPRHTHDPPDPQTKLWWIRIGGYHLICKESPHRNCLTVVLIHKGTTAHALDQAILKAYQLWQ